MSRTITSLLPRRGHPITLPLLPLVVLLAVAFLALPAAASSGDRNPTFQHCLRGCQLTYCDPSQPLISLWLRMAGWSCADNCKYSCAHSFTDNIRTGGRWHQCEYEYAEEGRVGSQVGRARSRGGGVGGGEMMRRGVEWTAVMKGRCVAVGRRARGSMEGSREADEEGKARRNNCMGKWKH